MKKAVFERQELCRRLAIDGKTLDEWQDCKIFGPFGFSDDHTPLYTESAVVEGEQIKRLQALGYGTREIQRIIRQIGLQDVEVKVQGSDILPIYDFAKQLAAELGRTPGLSGVNISMDMTKPEYRVHVDRARASALGIRCH